MKRQQKKTIRRDSVTGKLVPKWYADLNPRTTETERVRVGKRKKKS